MLLLIFPMVLHWGSSFLIGFMTIFVTLGLSCLMCFLALAHVGREFCRNLAQMQQQLFHFSLDNAKCSCCDRDHVNGRGQPVPCDRVIMVRCIEYWFHSREVGPLLKNIFVITCLCLLKPNKEQKSSSLNPKP